MPNQHNNKKYYAFISYRHADNIEENRQWATWLHTAIETYRVPTELVGKKNSRGELIPARIYPIFRDEEELPADADLSSAILGALDDSRVLIVLCSPNAVASTYVAEEIDYFKKLGHSDSIIAAMLFGEPNASWDIQKTNSGFTEEDEYFPVPLQFEYDENGNRTDKHTEVIAADFRFNHNGILEQGWTSAESLRQHLKSTTNDNNKKINEQVRTFNKKQHLMFLKIIAAIIRVPLRDLTQRDKEYQLELDRDKAKKLKRWLSVVSILIVIAIGASIFGYFMQQDALFSAQAEKVQRDIAGNLKETWIREGYEAPPLIEAVVLGDIEGVKKALKHGGNINERWGPDGMSSLMIACQIGHLQMVEWLLNNGADVKLTNNSGIESGLAAIHYAAESGQVGVFDIFAEHGFDLDQRAEGNATVYVRPIDVAAINSNVNVIKKLLELGIKIELYDDSISTSDSPLLWAAFMGKLQAVRFLVEVGANTQIKSSINTTAYEIASQQGHRNVADYLGQLGGMSTQENLSKQLWDSVSMLNLRDEAKIDDLISKGADVNYFDKRINQSLLMLAISNACLYNHKTSPIDSKTRSLSIYVLDKLLAGGANVTIPHENVRSMSKDVIRATLDKSSAQNSKPINKTDIYTANDFMQNCNAVSYYEELKLN